MKLFDDIFLFQLIHIFSEKIIEYLQCFNTSPRFLSNERKLQNAFPYRLGKFASAKDVIPGIFWISIPHELIDVIPEFGGLIIDNQN